MEKIKVFVADDHKLFIDTISRCLPQQFEVIGHALNGEDLLFAFRKHKVPDILILDLQMPKINGFEVFPSVRIEFPSVKIIIVSMFSERQIIKHFIQSGASGYLSKNLDYDELVLALNT